MTEVQAKHDRAVKQDKSRLARCRTSPPALPARVARLPLRIVARQR